jgi:hypothetical protein
VNLRLGAAVPVSAAWHPLGVLSPAQEMDPSARYI